MKLEKLKELHEDALLKIKVFNEEINKMNGIINNFINNVEQLNQEKREMEEECF